MIFGMVFKPENPETTLDTFMACCRFHRKIKQQSSFAYNDPGCPGLLYRGMFGWMILKPGSFTQIGN
jgi:hypothetical protein